jgi:hypothetical protein
MSTKETSGDGIACGVPVYSRTEALTQFLGSVPPYVETVYIAENGPQPSRAERAALYDGRDWPFALEVLDLDVDVGIGRCREAICEALTEPYLWMGDCDMVFVDAGDLRRLRGVLERNPDLGGVSGWLIEEATVRAGARQLVEHDGRLIKAVREPPDLEGEGTPFATFDFIPQAGLFRSEIYQTYSYDKAVRSTEHADFFYGHAQAGKWDFASTPAVLIEHNRRIDPDYRESRRGSDHVDETLLERKWDISGIEPGSNTDWAGYRDRTPAEKAFEAFRDVTPPTVWIPTRRILRRVVG